MDKTQKNTQSSEYEKLTDAEVVSRLVTNLITYQTDITERNSYIDKRDRYLYGDGLYENASIGDGADNTFYNFLRPITQIHASQFMQQDFGVFSYYDKGDATQQKPGEDDPVYTQTILDNKQKEIRAFAKNDLIQGMIRDNGGYQTFMTGAQVGSDYGSTLYQMYWDEKEQKIVWHLIESVQNWFPIWSSNDFRKRTGDAYILQIDPTIANRDYNEYMPEGGFPVTYAGEPLTALMGVSSTLQNQQGETVSSKQTRRPMVTIYDFTGYLVGVCAKGEDYYACKPGDETKLSFKAIGSTLISKITKAEFMPRFYYIPNSIVPARPYGESDIPEAALQINTTILQMKSDQLTKANKTLWPILQAIGFESGNVLPPRQREMTIAPMMQGQQLLPVHWDINTEYDRIIADLTVDLLRVCRVPRVLFDDPTVNLASNQALLTSMRPMTDTVTKKQKNWETALVAMFNDALDLAAAHVPEIREVVQTEDNSYLYIEWPSVLRKDDPAHQTMVLNDFNAGLMSVDTAMQMRGIKDVQEEIWRIQSAMEDPTRAAIQGHALPTMAHFAIQRGEGIPPWGYVLPKVTLRGDLPPQEVGNMGSKYGWDQGPYGGAIGPTGAAGTIANDNWLNSGQVTGNPFEGGMPSGVSPQGMQGAAPQGQVAPPQPPASAPTAPQMVPGQNQPGAMPMSQPGSGATSVTPGGALAQTMQRRGRR